MPILILSAPIAYPTEENKERFAVIKTTYDRAIEKGDKNVVLISGMDVMLPVRDVAIADNVHPADVGFMAMAKAILDGIEQLKIFR